MDGKYSVFVLIKFDCRLRNDEYSQGAYTAALTTSSVEYIERTLLGDVRITNMGKYLSFRYRCESLLSTVFVMVAYLLE